MYVFCVLIFHSFPQPTRSRSPSNPDIELFYVEETAANVYPESEDDVATKFFDCIETCNMTQLNFSDKATKRILKFLKTILATGNVRKIWSLCSYAIFWREMKLIVYQWQANIWIHICDKIIEYNMF